MKLLKIVGGETVLGNIIICKNSREKTAGLINTNGNVGAYLETRWGIHTFGMKFSIDVFLLDKANRIIKIKKNIPPKRFFFWSPKYSKILEIPSALRLNLKIDDVLEFC